jgi:hypothetical protein
MKLTPLKSVICYVSDVGSTHFKPAEDYVKLADAIAYADDRASSPENGRHAAPELEAVAWRYRRYDTEEKAHSDIWNLTSSREEMEVHKHYNAIVEPLYAAQAPVVPPTDERIMRIVLQATGWSYDGSDFRVGPAHGDTSVVSSEDILLAARALLAAHLQARTQDLTGKNACRSDSAESDAQAAERAAGIEFCAKWHDRKAWEHRAAGRTVNDLFHHTAAAELRALLLAPEDQNHSVAAGMHPPKPNEGTVWVHESHIDFATANAALAKVETNAAYHLHGDGTRSYLVSIHSLVAAGVSLPSEANGLSGGQS